MIFETKPADFNPSMEVVGCFVEHEGKILLLLRRDDKNEGNKWCGPGGKVEKTDKNIACAMSRELFEESKISISEEKFKYFVTLYIRYPTFDYVYHIFHVLLEPYQDVIIDDSHKAFLWATPQEALHMSLVLDEDECIKRFFKI